MGVKSASYIPLFFAGVEKCVLYTVILDGIWASYILSFLRVKMRFIYRNLWGWKSVLCIVICEKEKWILYIAICVGVKSASNIPSSVRRKNASYITSFVVRINASYIPLLVRRKSATYILSFFGRSVCEKCVIYTLILLVKIASHLSSFLGLKCAFYKPSFLGEWKCIHTVF